MNLNDVKLNTRCIIKSINLTNEKTKIRLMELGFVEGSFVSVNRRSVLKKTLLLILNDCCFTLKENLAQEIVVDYA